MQSDVFIIHYLEKTKINTADYEPLIIQNPIEYFKNNRKRIRDAAFFLIIMLVTFAATLLNPQKYVSRRTIQKCVEHVSTST